MSDQLTELAGILRNQLAQSQAQLEQHSRLVSMLRDELMDNRRFNNELIGVLGDLRDELEHLRTHRERVERFQRLADTVPARARAAGAARARARKRA